MSSQSNIESNDPAHVIAATQHWLTRAVIGLNLCPFAKAVYVKQQIRYVVSEARDFEAVITELEQALRQLADCDAQVIDTTLLILPDVLSNFDDFNDCLHLTDRLLKSMRLQGVLQIASFHPHYQFAGNQAGDIENYTNRAPYPILHLLREASIDRAVEAFPDAAGIYERNEATLRELGHAGWQTLMSQTDLG